VSKRGSHKISGVDGAPLCEEDGDEGEMVIGDSGMKRCVSVLEMERSIKRGGSGANKKRGGGG
jgi:hypothetical protein